MSEDKQVLKVEMSFPSNSHKDRAERKTGGESKKETEGKGEENRKVDKVVSGKVIQRKKPLGKRFMETFVGDDIKNVKSYIFNDVLIPAAKDTISDVFQGITDAIQGSIEVSLFGERRSRSSRGRSSSNRSYVSYDKYSNKDRDRDRRDDRRDISNRDRARHNFDDIVLDNRGDADEVIDNLVEMISKYGQATVADLYDLVGITGNFTDNKWGWDNLRSSSVSRTRGGGYVLNLPKPEFLD